MFSWDGISKKILVLAGICFLAGSLCACGDDTNVIIFPKREPLTSEQEERMAEQASEGNSLAGISLEKGDCNSEETTDWENTNAQDVVSITISAAGDVTLGNYPEQGYSMSLPQIYEQVQDDSYFFENVADIFAADDMTIVNLEGVLTNAEEKREGVTYNIKGKPEYVKILTSGDIEAVSMANNHRLDYLQQGSDETVSLLEEENIVYAYDEKVGIYEVEGIRIGIVSVNEIAWGTGVEAFLMDGIGLLKEESVDLIFACCHWGIEKEYYPEDYQQELGRRCIDWGADLVIGHHPHVLQGIEEYNGKYIIYSLGNFCFGANRNPVDKDTMIFQQTFTFVDGEKQEDNEVRVIPCSISSVKDRNDYKPTPAVGEEAQRIIDKINEYSKDFGVKFDSEGNLLN